MKPKYLHVTIVVLAVVFVAPAVSEADLVTVALEDLIATVESMNIRQGIDNSFDMKLEAVHDALVAANAGDRSDAVNKLEAFINAVEAQREKELTVEQADLLVYKANVVIQGGCDVPPCQ